MPIITGISRRALLSTTASLVATGASFMVLPNSDAMSSREAEASPVQGGHHTDDEMKKCIQLCRDCHAMCTETITYCLKLGGRHATAAHMRLMTDCAQMCATSADYMIRESPVHARLCRLCAELCTQCANDCQEISGDDQGLQACIEMCRKCASACERMASHVAA